MFNNIIYSCIDRFLNFNKSLINRYGILIIKNLYRGLSLLLFVFLVYKIGLFSLIVLGICLYYIESTFDKINKIDKYNISTTEY